MKEQGKKLVIAIPVFNRPNLLAKTLSRLAEQVSEKVQVFLFPDKPDNDAYDMRMSIPIIEKLQDAQNDIFMRVIPHGKIFPASEHLSVMLNERRAFLESFERTSCDRVLVMKDNLFLHSRYIEMIMNVMDKFEDDKRVGMIQLHGNTIGTVEEQLEHKGKFEIAGPKAAWGMWRDRWEATYPMFVEHTNLLGKYAKDNLISRDSCMKLIRDWYSSFGKVFGEVSSGFLLNSGGSLHQILQINRMLSLASYSNYLFHMGADSVGFNKVDMNFIKHRGNMEIIPDEETCWEWKWDEIVYNELSENRKIFGEERKRTINYI